MGGVHIADQLRSNYPLASHQTSQRNWLPLWFWILDTAITNTYLIARLVNPKYEHKAFCPKLALTLAETGCSQLHPLLTNPKPDSHAYVTAKTSLPPFFFRTTGAHLQPFLPNKKHQCWYCQYKKCNDDSKYPPPIRQRAEILQKMKVSETGIWSALCEIPLCKRNRCFFDYHTLL